EAAAVEGLTRLRGRGAELASLVQACEAAAAGEGRFVSVVGDAGVGKSRLLYELDRRLDPDRFEIVRGRCQSFGADVPYLPFVDVLRDRLGIAELPGDATPALVTERVRAIAPELEDFTPFYFQLLGLGEEERALQEAAGGEQLRVGLVESLSALLTLGARDLPTIVLLEDWHWVDAASRQVLRQLLEMVSAYSLTIIVTARPEEGLGWGTPAGHVPIVLGPLTSDDSAAVVRHVLDAIDVPAPLTRFLHDRTGGNPFFLEEVCQALREDGTLRVAAGRVSVAGALDALELPDTVQGVLRTRLDRLDGETRRIVRYASVIGREFGGDVLEHALGEERDVAQELNRLRDLGLIQQIRVVPSVTYRFKHALTQDVAYDGLLERHRSEIHGAVGEAIETLHPDRLDDHFDRLAEHFEQARRWEKAVEYSLAATDRLWSLSEFHEASELQQHALELAGRFDDPQARVDKEIEILLRQERLLEYLGLRERQQVIIDRLLQMLDPERNRRQLATTHVRQGDLFILTREHEGAERALEEALRLSLEIGDPALERDALRSMGLLLWHQERHEEAVKLTERALELDRKRENHEGVIGSLANLGQLHRAMGENERALEYLEQGLELERRIGRGKSYGEFLRKESYILHVMGSIHASLGDHDKAREYLEAAKASVEGGTSSTNVVQMHFHLTAMARLNLSEGRIDDALELYGEAVSMCRRTRHLEGLSTSVRLLGEVLLNLERYEEALPHLLEAAELLGRMRDRPAEAAMWRAVALARERVAAPEEAIEAWTRAGELAERQGHRTLELEAAEHRGRLLEPSDLASALQAYGRSLELALAIGDLGKAGGFRYTIGVIHWRFGAYDEALKSFESAYELLSAEGLEKEAGLALNSVGRTLRDLGRLEEAKARLQAAIDLNHESGETLLEAHALAASGDVYLDLEEPTEASERFSAALELRKSLDDEAGQGWVLCRLARAQGALGSTEGFAFYLDEAEEIASRTGDLELAGECRSLRRKGAATDGG
ncbi:MAG: tetratricopeptide repeat protein, partial [Gemmatimonadetes bacterium]|nr:tetratricopeptide repeat protein [Gemmatimonadota bacterium]